MWFEAARAFSAGSPGRIVSGSWRADRAVCTGPRARTRHSVVSTKITTCAVISPYRKQRDLRCEKTRMIVDVTPSISGNGFHTADKPSA
jgi:hypothetical protein